MPNRLRIALLAISFGLMAHPAWASHALLWSKDNISIVEGPCFPAPLLDIDHDGHLDAIFNDVVGGQRVIRIVDLATGADKELIELSGDYISAYVRATDLDGDGWTELLIRELSQDGSRSTTFAYSLGHSFIPPAVGSAR